MRLLLICGLLIAGCAPDLSPSPSLVKINEGPSRETDVARSLNDRAAILIERSDYDGAERVLKQAVAADAYFGPAHNNLGVVYYRQSKLYAAKQEFVTAAELLPRDPDPRNGLGLIFESAGRYDDAVGYYDRARALDPGNYEYLGNAARVRVRRGDRTDELRLMLGRIAGNDPRNEWSRWAREAIKPTGGGSTTAP